MDPSPTVAKPTLRMPGAGGRGREGGRGGGSVAGSSRGGDAITKGDLQAMKDMIGDIKRDPSLLYRLSSLPGGEGDRGGGGGGGDGAEAEATNGEGGGVEAGGGGRKIFVDDDATEVSSLGMMSSSDYGNHGGGGGIHRLHHPHHSPQPQSLSSPGAARGTGIGGDVIQLRAGGNPMDRSAFAAATASAIRQKRTHDAEIALRMQSLRTKRGHHPPNGGGGGGRPPPPQQHGRSPARSGNGDASGAKSPGAAGSAVVAYNQPSGRGGMDASPSGQVTMHTQSGRGRHDHHHRQQQQQQHNMRQRQHQRPARSSSVDHQHRQRRPSRNLGGSGSASVASGRSRSFMDNGEFDSSGFNSSASFAGVRSRSFMDNDRPNSNTQVDLNSSALVLYQDETHDGPLEPEEKKDLDSGEGVLTVASREGGYNNYNVRRQLAEPPSPTAGNYHSGVSKYVADDAPSQRGRRGGNDRRPQGQVRGHHRPSTTSRGGGGGGSGGPDTLERRASVESASSRASARSQRSQRSRSELPRQRSGGNRVRSNSIQSTGVRTRSSSARPGGDVEQPPTMRSSNDSGQEYRGLEPPISQGGGAPEPILDRESLVANLRSEQKLPQHQQQRQQRQTHFPNGLTSNQSDQSETERNRTSVREEGSQQQMRQEEQIQNGEKLTPEPTTGPSQKAAKDDKRRSSDKERNDKKSRRHRKSHASKRRPPKEDSKHSSGIDLSSEGGEMSSLGQGLARIANRDHDDHQHPESECNKSVISRFSHLSQLQRKVKHKSSSKQSLGSSDSMDNNPQRHPKKNSVATKPASSDSGDSHRMEQRPKEGRSGEHKSKGLVSRLSHNFGGSGSGLGASKRRMTDFDSSPSQLRNLSTHDENPFNLSAVSVHSDKMSQSDRAHQQYLANDDSESVVAGIELAMRSGQVPRLCDERGRCLFHPHIRLQKPKLFGGVKVLFQHCPDCAVEHMKKTQEQLLNARRQKQRRERQERERHKHQHHKKGKKKSKKKTADPRAAKGREDDYVADNGTKKKAHRKKRETRQNEQHETAPEPKPSVEPATAAEPATVEKSTAAEPVPVEQKVAEPSAMELEAIEPAPMDPEPLEPTAVEPTESRSYAVDTFEEQSANDISQLLHHEKNGENSEEQRRNKEREEHRYDDREDEPHKQQLLLQQEERQVQKQDPEAVEEKLPLPEEPPEDFTSSLAIVGYKLKPQTKKRVNGLPWSDYNGQSGRYTGEVNAQFLPHGHGEMVYDHGAVSSGIWYEGVLDNEGGGEEAGDAYNSMVPAAHTPDALPNFSVGDKGKDEDMIIEGKRATSAAVAELRVGDAAFVRRSDGSWTYAIVKDRSHDGENQTIRFKVNLRGSTKAFPTSQWGTYVRRIKCRAGAPPAKKSPSSLGDFLDRSKNGIVGSSASVSGNMMMGRGSSSDAASVSSTHSAPLITRSSDNLTTAKMKIRTRSRSRSRNRKNVTTLPLLFSSSMSVSEENDEGQNNDDWETASGSGYRLRGIDP